MQGPSQHNIPQMLQRGFHIRGARNETWLFTEGELPERKAIRFVGEGTHFYSEPPVNDDPTLDGKITEYEGTQFGALLTRLKQQTVGTEIASEDAAQVVAHLTMRAAYIRNVFARGIEHFAGGAVDIFTNSVLVERLIGLDSPVPSERFHEHIGKSLAENPQVQEAGIPLPLVERMAFTFAKENFQGFFAEQRPAIEGVLGLLAGQSEKTAREGHNKALQADFRGAKRGEQLQSFQWRIEASPSEGLILPDCVALGFRPGELPIPYLACDNDQLAAVALPLSSTKLLVGWRRGGEPPPLDEINRDLAACSDAFFIAATDRTEFTDLAPSIGTRSSTVIDDAVDDVLDEYTCDLGAEAAAAAAESPNLDTVLENEDEPTELSPPQDLNYQITLSGWSDQETMDRIVAAVRATVSSLSRIMPLQRLDGITFAADYPAALQALDRGIPGVPSPTTVSPDVGVGIAMAPVVLRDGVIKARVILVAGVAEALISDDEDQRRWALHIMANELALVAMIEITDRTLPATILRPIADPLDRLLFGAVNSALDGYVAARTAAFLAPGETLAAYQEVLIGALERAHQVIPKERLAYRFHGNMDQLLAVTFPAVGHVLEFAAHLLGLCDGTDASPFDEEGKLAAALDKCGLRAWLAVFRADLQGFYDRLGAWESFDEFLSFNRHVERIVWQFGLVPWRNEEDGVYVKVPYGSDALALAEAAAAGEWPALTTGPGTP